MEVEMAARTILNSTDTWMEALEVSRDRVLAAARSGPHGAAVLAHAAAGRIVAAWTADPAPIDPVAHVEQTHAKGSLVSRSRPTARSGEASTTRR